MSCFASVSLIHTENILLAMPTVTPSWIEPEWYFLPFYAVLRAVPHKLGGTLALALSIVVLGLLPLSAQSTVGLPVVYDPL